MQKGISNWRTFGYWSVVTGVNPRADLKQAQFREGDYFRGPIGIASWFGTLTRDLSEEDAQMREIRVVARQDGPRRPDYAKKC